MRTVRIWRGSFASYPEGDDPPTYGPIHRYPVVDNTALLFDLWPTVDSREDHDLAGLIADAMEEEPHGDRVWVALRDWMRYVFMNRTAIRPAWTAAYDAARRSPAPEQERIHAVGPDRVLEDPE